MHERSFWKINGNFDEKEFWYPKQLFALRIGQAPVDPSIGRFVVKQEYVNRSDPTLSSSKELPLNLCSQIASGDPFKDADHYESLYCLEDFSSYTVRGTKPENEIYSISIAFEICRPGLGVTCAQDGLTFLQR